MASFPATNAQRAAELFEVDYPAYLSSHDIVFHSPPMDGYEGLPLGNGDLGGMMWCTRSGLTMQINKNDTWEQPAQEQEMLLRSCGQLTIDCGAPCCDWLYLNDFEARLSMYSAQASFSADTPFMHFTSTGLAQANRNVLLLKCQVEGRGGLSDQGSPVRITLERWGSRAFGGWYHGITRPADLGLGKATSGIKDKDIYIQEKLSGLDFAMVCRVIGANAKPAQNNSHSVEVQLPGKSVQQFIIMVAVATGNESKEPLAEAIRLLDQCEQKGIDGLFAEHQDWWKDFWGRSFVHLGDDYLENLYYFHQYLMGSGSRGRYPLMFNAGIWTWNHDVRQWISPHHWNMQQAYWSVCSANHCELLKPYLDTYWRLLPKAEEYATQRGYTNAILWNEKHDYAGRMIYWQGGSFTNNFTPATQIGQLFWQYYLYTGDEQFLRERAYPFMKKAAEFYLQYLKWDDEKKQYYIFPSSPYESEAGNQVRNTLTDLAMIRVSFRACIQAGQVLHQDADKVKQWQSVLDHLAAYPVRNMDDKGQVLAIGEEKTGQALTLGGGDGYTFCANLSPVFPAGDVGLDQKDSATYQAVVRRAKSHPPHTLAISPIAVVDARLGLAEDAIQHLATSIRQLQHFPQGFFYNLDHWSYLSRYAERVTNAIIACQRDYIYDHAAKYQNVNVYGQQSTKEKINTPTQPFVQCGLEPSAILAATINEMLLQSYSGRIRVFPATPAAWPAAFTLRAAGGFLVSSEKRSGQVPEYVIIKSVLGKECRLMAPWTGESVVEQIEPARKSLDVQVENETLRFPTAMNSVYVIRPAQVQKETNPKPGTGGATRFTGEKNMKPKLYQEAILGKARDF